MNTNNNLSPTPYDDINSFLQILLKNVQTVLGDYFIGLYLFGSLATGDFDHGRSDLDFLVITTEMLPENLISNLKTMHARICKSSLEWAVKMSGAYIPIDAMREYSPTGPACPLVNKEEFLVARPDPDWVIHRHILYTSGIEITGPPLQTIIDPVSPEQLQSAVFTLLRHNWTPWIDNPNLFLGIEYSQPFVVLTMCRALYTLKQGTVVSKRRSAQWVMANSDRKWNQLINQALAWHNGDSHGDICQTQEFMRYIFKEAGL